jgi:hypothetical protein
LLPLARDLCALSSLGPSKLCIKETSILSASFTSYLALLVLTGENCFYKTPKPTPFFSESSFFFLPTLSPSSEVPIFNLDKEGE